MTIIHEQIYDGGWLVRIRHSGRVYTGTGWSWEAALQEAKRAAGLAPPRGTIIRKVRPC